MAESSPSTDPGANSAATRVFERALLPIRFALGRCLVKLDIDFLLTSIAGTPVKDSTYFTSLWIASNSLPASAHLPCDASSR
jgi:hypothetical protein